jgi:ribosome-associated toxin RatA of RatAB toxin-antitoxin module
MREVVRSALMSCTAQQMIDVVNDVEQYPKFLPWCVSSEILESTSDLMVARLVLAKGGIRQSFSTRNRLDVPTRIDISLDEGPFSTLEGRWSFSPLGEEGCKVDMTLRFDFDSRVMNVTLGKVFSSAADRLVDAFCERADMLYGRP